MPLVFCVNADLLAVTTPALKLHSAVDHSEQCVIGADANALTGMDVGTTLANEDVACGDELTVRTLHTKTLGLGISAVLGRTHTFLMCKKLHTDSQHNSYTSVISIVIVPG